MNGQKILVANTKGGVGKSTVSMQVLVPFLFEATKTPVTLYEFDDENEDSKSFGDSRIVKTVQVKVATTELREKIGEIMLDDSSAVIDVGANKTASIIVKALCDGGMIHALDLAVIPLMDGEIDAVSAVSMYIALKDVAPSLKIMFVLNRVNSSRDLHCQFDMFLGDKRGFFNEQGLIENIKEEDRQYFLLHDSDAIKYSRQFGMTVWELAHLNRDLEDELKKAIKSNEDKKHIKFLSFKCSLQKDCQNYKTSTLVVAFEKIKRRLED